MTIKKQLLRFVLFFSFLCGSQFLSAQCIHGVGTFNDSANAGVGSGTTISLIGQTFTATATGNVTSISLGVGAATTAATHEFRIGASTNPPTAEIGGPAYQTFTTSGGAEMVTINLNTPFAVTAGSVYAFDFTFSTAPGTIWGLQFSNVNDYPIDGEYYGNNPGTVGFFSQSTFDNDFGVCISPSSSGSPAGIPTLSEWGLIILALLLMTLGTLYLVQPNWREGLNRNS